MRTRILPPTSLSFLLVPASMALACGSHPTSSALVRAAEGADRGLARIDFQDMQAGQPPRAFTSALTGGGPPSTWAVVVDPATPGAQALAQTSSDDTDYRFPLCILDGFEAKDVSVSVRFRAVEGRVDRAGGLVVRYRDAGNYYITRANALEDNVRLYHVVDGQREEFAGATKTVSAGEWHTLRLDANGPRFAVFFDGELLFTAEDATFTEAGRIGLWTKADSVTWFDDLRYGPVLPESPTIVPAPVSR